ncbi:speedy protein 1-A-like [Rhinophrynus dorsalis]
MAFRIQQQLRSRSTGPKSPDQCVPRTREESGACSDQNADCVGSKRRRTTEEEELKNDAFYLLLENDVIQRFLRQDTCQRISDKYLLAMVFCYFRRAGLLLSEYTASNFFIALFLANNMEEDMCFREDIYPWAVDIRWPYEKTHFHRVRGLLWARMGFRARVTRLECEKIISENPYHWAWQRERKEQHGWARRHPKRYNEELLPRDPHLPSPPSCFVCRAISSEHHPAQWRGANNNTPSSAESAEDVDSDTDVVN